MPMIQSDRNAIYISELSNGVETDRHLLTYGLFTQRKAVSPGPVEQHPDPSENEPYGVQWSRRRRYMLP